MSGGTFSCIPTKNDNLRSFSMNIRFLSELLTAKRKPVEKIYLKTSFCLKYVTLEFKLLCKNFYEINLLSSNRSY